MNGTLGMHSRRSRRGTTLVEAVAGTALLGSLLVSILIGASRLQAQAARAERRIEACRVADGLLKGWWAKRDEFPREARGTVPGHNGWRWRTRGSENESARALGGEIVALEIFAPEASSDRAATRIEVFLPEGDDERAGPDAG